MALPQPFHFSPVELARLARAEPCERQARIAAAVELRNGMADRGEHPLDLVLAALVDRQLALVGGEAASPPRGGQAVVQLDPFLEPAEGFVRGLALNFSLVDL